MPIAVVNAASPMMTMKTAVPILAPRDSAANSPYPMVVIEMILYQKASPMPGPPVAPPSNR